MLVCDLLDSPGVVRGVLPQKVIGQLVEGGHRGLALAQVLKEGLEEKQ